jgi:nucleoside phosphorylase
MAPGLLDVLFVAPLAEEAKAFEHWLTDLAPFPGIPQLRRSVHDGISVGVYCLEEMGGINAATGVTPVLTRTRPRVVVVVGIAAGVEEGTRERWNKRRGDRSPARKWTRAGRFVEFGRGDVGIADMVWYYSYGRMSGDRFTVRQAPTQMTDEPLRRLATEVLREEAWRETARAWFDTAQATGWAMNYDFPEQRWPVRPPRGERCDVASGEQVVASTKYMDGLLRSFDKASLVWLRWRSTQLAVHARRSTLRLSSSHFAVSVTMALRSRTTSTACAQRSRQ